MQTVPDKPKKQKTASYKTKKKATVISLPKILHQPFWSPSKFVASQLLWSPTLANILPPIPCPLNVRTEHIATHQTWFHASKILPVDPVDPPKLVSEYISNEWPTTKGNVKLPSINVDTKGKITPPKAKVSDVQVAATKVKLHPRNTHDRQVLKQTFGAARRVYNKCVEISNDPDTKAELAKTVDPKTGKPSTMQQFLRYQVVNNESPYVTQNQWLLNIASDIRGVAMKDFIAAQKANFTQMKNKAITTFKMGYKSLKYINSESFYVRRQWISQTNNSIIIKLPNQKKIVLWTGKNAWHGTINMDCRLQRTWTNDYFLCIPNAIEVDNQDLITNNHSEENNDIPPLRVCALDPGVRTFQTMYDPSSITQVGDKDMKRIVRMCIEQDRLISKQNNKETRSHRRCHIKRAVRRLRTRVQNIVNEVHKQLAKHLAKTYDLIMIPSFEVSQMVRKQDRKIRSTTARQMMTWAHFRFRERLIHKCRQYNCKVAIVNEAFTSKTCSCCGALHNKLGSSKVFKCPTCGVVMDRDANGAKNIFLRNFEALGISISSLGAYPLQPGNGLVHGSSLKRVSAECQSSE